MPKLPGQTIVEERQEKRGDSWETAGEILKIMDATIRPMQDWPYLIPVVLIVLKLCRAGVDPYDKDHWADIQGYAQLAINAINREFYS